MEQKTFENLPWRPVLGVHRVWEEGNGKTDEIYDAFLSAFPELEGGHFNLKGFTHKFSFFTW